jgi:hypothetical protein
VGNRCKRLPGRGSTSDAIIAQRARARYAPHT